MSVAQQLVESQFTKPNNGWIRLAMEESAACWKTNSFRDSLDLSSWNLGMGEDIADGRNSAELSWSNWAR